MFRDRERDTDADKGFLDRSLIDRRGQWRGSDIGADSAPLARNKRSRDPTSSAAPRRGGHHTRVIGSFRKVKNVNYNAGANDVVVRTA